MGIAGGRTEGEGTDDGTEEGTEEGTAEGCMEGTEVGTEEGTEVGCKDGRLVGSALRVDRVVELPAGYSQAQLYEVLPNVAFQVPSEEITT